MKPKAKTKKPVCAKDQILKALRKTGQTAESLSESTGFSMLTTRRKLKDLAIIGEARVVGHASSDKPGQKAALWARA